MVDLEQLRALRALGMTKYKDSEHELEFGASVVMNDAEPVSRMLDEEEEEEIAKRVLDKHQRKLDEDLYGAT